MKFEIGHKSTIFMGCKFDAARGLSIGDNSVIQGDCRIDTRGGIIIGNNVSISNSTILLTVDHDVTSPHFSTRAKQMVIEDYVWIGTRAMVLLVSKVAIGSVIAAGSVVTKNVEEYKVVAGIPARAIKNRSNCLSYSIDYVRLFH